MADQRQRCAVLFGVRGKGLRSYSNDLIKKMRKALEDRGGFECDVRPDVTSTSDMDTRLQELSTKYEDREIFVFISGQGCAPHNHIFCGKDVYDLESKISTIFGESKRPDLGKVFFIQACFMVKADPDCDDSVLLPTQTNIVRFWSHIPGNEQVNAVSAFCDELEAHPQPRHLDHIFTSIISRVSDAHPNEKKLLPMQKSTMIQPFLI